MCGGGDDYAKKLREQEKARQLEIKQGTKSINQAFKPFDQDFYGDRAQSYEKFAMPQLNDQRQDASNELLFALARGGTLDSTIRTGQEAELQKLYGTERQNVVDKGLDYKQQAQSGVEDARDSLLRTLQTSANSKQAQQQAAARAAALTETPAYSPVGQVFQDFTSGLGKQFAAERAYSLGSGVKPSFSTGLFSVPSSSVRVS